MFLSIESISWAETITLFSFTLTSRQCAKTDLKNEPPRTDHGMYATCTTMQFYVCMYVHVVKKKKITRGSNESCSSARFGKDVYGRDANVFDSGK